MQIAIVVDPNFGAELPALAAQLPVWIAHTPSNRAAAERWWAGPRAPEVTTFQVDAATSPGDWLLGVLPVVEEHAIKGEGALATQLELEVRGAALTPELQAQLKESGYVVRGEAPGGFRLRRLDAA